MEVYGPSGEAERHRLGKVADVAETPATGAGLCLRSRFHSPVAKFMWKYSSTNASTSRPSANVDRAGCSLSRMVMIGPRCGHGFSKKFEEQGLFWESYCIKSQKGQKNQKSIYRGRRR